MICIGYQHLFEFRELAWSPFSEFELGMHEGITGGIVYSIGVLDGTPDYGSRIRSFGFSGSRRYLSGLGILWKAVNEDICLLQSVLL